MSRWLIAVRRRALFVALLLSAASVLAHLMRPTIHLADQHARVNLETLFPLSFGSWRQDPNLPVAIVSPDVEAMLKSLYAQTLSRTYIGPQGERIMLSVAYGGDQSDATRAHRPDVCYPAQGFDIVSSHDAALSLGAGLLPVRNMLAKLGSRSEPVTFWFIVGEHVAVSGQQQKLAQLRYSLRGTIPDGMLIRVSSIDPNAAAGYAVQSRFISDMHTAMSAAARLRVFGTALVN